MLKKQRKIKILVLERDERISQLLLEILTKEGHAVETADDGLKGVELFEKKEFDLVFTDLGMPGMNGWQVAEKIKSINERVPVVLITGCNIEPKELEHKKKWIDHIIYKPFEIDQVLGIV